MTGQPFRLSSLKPGETVALGNTVYGRCVDCEEVIQVNKFLFGSLHICLTDEEIAAKRKHTRWEHL